MITLKEKESVFIRDGYKCRECGISDRLTIDHIVPKDEGGNDHVNNLQTLCYPCNQRKGNKHKIPFMKHLL